MTIPRITSLLIMLALGRDALALQLGQVSTQSLRGQTLAARIALYGLVPARDDAMAVEIMAAFGAPQDSLAALGVNARVVTENNGAAYIAITSSAAIDADRVALRIRLKEGRRAMVRRYDLMLATAHAAQTIARLRQIPTSVAPAVVAVQTSAYGPVRAGQSLWRIMRETGRGDDHNGTVMARIVAANPAAFIGGDATRLRVGAMLQLPAATGPAKTVTRATAIHSTEQVSEDPQLRARLERLATKFALLRARYDERKQQRPVTSELAHETVAPAPTLSATPLLAPSTLLPERKTTPTASTAQFPTPTGGATVSKPKTAAAPRADSSNGTLTALSNHVEGETPMRVGGAALLLVLLILGARLVRRLRGRHAALGVRNADRSLVAEIARKTAKRIQLESEVKRTIAARRDTLANIEASIAHGQYDEAEALLEEVITATPDNHRAKLQLAEIYYLNQRHADFIELSEQIQRQHRGDIGDENWARLMRMGKVIAPDQPPFSGPVAVESGRRAS